MQHNHFINLETWDFDTLSTLLFQAAFYKKMEKNEIPQPLQNQHWVVMFEKPSLRTRLSFEIGIQKMGGKVLFMDCQEAPIGKRESVHDLAKNIACYADGVVVRANSHQTLCELASHCEIPLINALCDRYHPCQALADFQTLKEMGLCQSDNHIAYVGDGNNVCHSLLQIAAIFDLNFTVLTPEGYEPDAEIVAFAKSRVKKGNITVTSDIDSVKDVDVVYTDSWLSMGSNYSRSQVEKDFSRYQINDSLMKKLQAKYFMHCQPIKRGEEVTSSIADASNSLIYQQSENRLWAQMAILNYLTQGK